MTNARRVMLCLVALVSVMAPPAYSFTVQLDGADVAYTTTSAAIYGGSLDAVVSSFYPAQTPDPASNIDGSEGMVVGLVYNWSFNGGCIVAGQYQWTDGSKDGCTTAFAIYNLTQTWALASSPVVQAFHAVKDGAIVWSTAFDSFIVNNDSGGINASFYGKATTATQVCTLAWSLHNCKSWVALCEDITSLTPTPTVTLIAASPTPTATTVVPLPTPTATTSGGCPFQIEGVVDSLQTVNMDGQSPETVVNTYFPGKNYVSGEITGSFGHMVGCSWVLDVHGVRYFIGRFLWTNTDNAARTGQQTAVLISNDDPAALNWTPSATTAWANWLSRDNASWSDPTNFDTSLTGFAIEERIVFGYASGRPAYWYLYDTNHAYFMDIVTQTPTPTSTFVPSATRTRTRTATATRTNTVAALATSTQTRTATKTAVPSATFTKPPTATSTPTRTGTVTPTPTACEFGIDGVVDGLHPGSVDGRSPEDLVTEIFPNYSAAHYIGGDIIGVNGHLVGCGAIVDVHGIRFFFGQFQWTDASSVRYGQKTAIVISNEKPGTEWEVDSSYVHAIWFSRENGSWNDPSNYDTIFDAFDVEGRIVYGYASGRRACWSLSDPNTAIFLDVPTATPTKTSTALPSATRTATRTYTAVPQATPTATPQGDCPFAVTGVVEDKTVLIVDGWSPEKLAGQFFPGLVYQGGELVGGNGHLVGCGWLIEVHGIRFFFGRFEWTNKTNHPWRYGQMTAIVIANERPCSPPWTVDPENAWANWYSRDNVDWSDPANFDTEFTGFDVEDRTIFGIADGHPARWDIGNTNGAVLLDQEVDCTTADLDGNGKVDATDVILFQQCWRSHH